MAKNFSPRVSKKNRTTISMDDNLSRDLLKMADEKLLEGARLEEVRLKSIRVKDQVRTKFNDKSIKDLAENIRTNGLIQPLVVHKENDGYVLICGERRYRAMTSIEMVSAPCFILDDKSEEELMAIQFSENSSREALHYIDKADGILNYQRATRASERKIQAALGISKSEVHRSLLIARMPKKFKEAAKIYDIEKYVLLELDALEETRLKKAIEKKVLSGEIVKRAQLKKAVKTGLLSAGKKIKTQTRKAPSVAKGLTANAFLKAMDSKSKELKLDKKTRDALDKLLNETKDLVDL